MSFFRRAPRDFSSSHIPVRVLVILTNYYWVYQVILNAIIYNTLISNKNDALCNGATFRAERVLDCATTRSSKEDFRGTKLPIFRFDRCTTLVLSNSSVQLVASNVILWSHLGRLRCCLVVSSCVSSTLEACLEVYGRETFSGPSRG